MYTKRSAEKERDGAVALFVRLRLSAPLVLPLPLRPLPLFVSSFAPRAGPPRVRSCGGASKVNLNRRGRGRKGLAVAGLRPSAAKSFLAAQKAPPGARPLRASACFLAVCGRPPPSGGRPRPFGRPSGLAVGAVLPPVAPQSGLWKPGSAGFFIKSPLVPPRGIKKRTYLRKK